MVNLADHRATSRVLTGQSPDIKVHTAKWLKEEHSQCYSRTEKGKTCQPFLDSEWFEINVVKHFFDLFHRVHKQPEHDDVVDTKLAH
ncbi:hypothetical protein Csa_001094 [Cucumis sativus]|nr:hypothetical protein Csa_001094 [Cucumis sativus]